MVTLQRLQSPVCLLPCNLRSFSPAWFFLLIMQPLKSHKAGTSCRPDLTIARYRTMKFDSFTICPKDRCKSFASFVISVDLHGAYTERALGEASLVRPSAVGACAALADFSTALPPETGIQKAEREWKNTPELTAFRSASQAWAISSAASLFAWRGLRCRKALAGA